MDSFFYFFRLPKSASICVFSQKIHAAIMMSAAAHGATFYLNNNIPSLIGFGFRWNTNIYEA